MTHAEMVEQVAQEIAAWLDRESRLSVSGLAFNIVAAIRPAVLLEAAELASSHVSGPEAAIVLRRLAEGRNDEG